MNKLLLIALSLFILQGCSITPDTDKSDKELEVSGQKSAQEQKTMQRKSDDEYLYYYVAHSFSQADIEKEATQERIGMQTESNGYGKMYSFNGEKSLILSEVVSKMADQLLYNFPKKYHPETIALTSIVDLNDHSVTNWLGQTVSEQFIHELHIRQLHVIDFKLTGNIQLTKAGEFALTRDWTKLNKNVNVSRILTGTMSRNEEGIIFNMRIVNANSNLVESTSSAFIPRNLFVGGQYDYQNKKYYERDSRLVRQNKAQVRIVK
tara:strand:+ start:2481 stop:3272 length:792 start_codon:yes stop_codon:yes gene_type:complete